MKPTTSISSCLLSLLVVAACDHKGTVTPQPPSAAVDLRLESLFLGEPARIGGEDRLPAHTVSLRLTGSSDAAMEGTLALDPNTCTLNAFGDREICTLIATFGVEVEVERLQVDDPADLGRRLYRVQGDGLPPELRMVVQGQLREGDLERAYLLYEGRLVPLFVDDGR